MGKVHGGLANSGKVRGQTPKVEPQDKQKPPKGRAGMRKKYNKNRQRLENPEVKHKGPNAQHGQAV